MDFDAVEWDEGNLDHATSRWRIGGGDRAGNQQRSGVPAQQHHSDRRRIEARTDEGRNLVVIIQLLGSGRARPITAWEVT